jgi:hypothetical protein
MGIEPNVKIASAFVLDTICRIFRVTNGGIKEKRPLLGQ